MTERKKSKEERFIIKAFEFASGNPDSELDRYVVGRAIGEHDKSIDNVVQLLTKNGLIRKGEDQFISLTAAGIHFVKTHC